MNNFVRDQIDVSDIEKTKPKKLYPYEMRGDKELPEGANVRKRFTPKDGPDILNVKDINNVPKNIYHREVNPLNPEYKIAGEEKMYG